MLEFITKNSGKSVKINPAAFKDAICLKKAALKCLQNAGVLEDITTEKLKTLDVSNLLKGISKLVIEMDTSQDFENAIFDCLKVCIYDNKFSITSQLFDDKPEIQEDYYEIIIKCCEVNLRPFFKSLSSELSTRFNDLELELPKSEQPQTQN